MTEIPFTPDSEVRVHAEGAIRQICAPYRSHDDGLPEWIKNASDAYARLDIAPRDAVIVVLLQDGKQDFRSMVGCLDFGGMTTSDIENKFRSWADPNAAGEDDDVEGGHGNGGKCYMTQLFDDHSMLHTCLNGRASKYGFKGGSATPGYFPSPDQGRAYRIESTEDELNAALKPFGLTVGTLPPSARSLFLRRQAFTLVMGVGAKNLVRDKINVVQWLENLRGHQQMVRPIQRNQVVVLHNGRAVDGGNPLQLDQIVPLPGAEAPRVVPIPEQLVDPDTGEPVNTGAILGDSRLELRTCKVSMRHSLKSRHTINGWTHAGRSTGYWEVPALSRATYHKNIYGDVYLDQLTNYKQNDRRNHSNAPLTRALRDWIAARIDDYSAEFVKLDELNASKEEQEELSRQNDALNKWKNEFLEQEFGGVGDGTGRGGGSGKPRYKLPRGEVARVVVALGHAFAGQGVTFRPSVEFFDKDGRRVRPVPHEWVSTDWAVATADAELNAITTHRRGVTTLSVVCKDSGVASNLVDLEVLDIESIDLTPQSMELPARSRQLIEAKVSTRDGRRIDDIYLIWTENDRAIVSVSSGGMVFGLTPGSTVVTAGDNQVESGSPTQVTVLDAKDAGERGSGFPKILLSEIDTDPLGEHPPKFSNADPPVLQRAQDVDANIWWINMASPLARRYIDTARGSGAKSKEWRVYLLERYIEIMVKILLAYDFTHGQEITFETMLRRWEEEAAQMQQRATDSLSLFLDGGGVWEL